MEYSLNHSKTSNACQATGSGTFIAKQKRRLVAFSLVLCGLGLSLFPKTSAALISNDQFFGWVEAMVPQYLGGTLGSITVPNWGQYRGPYPTGNYLGVMNDGGIYVYGPMVGNVLTRLGQVSDFTCQIQNTFPPPPPPPPTLYADKVYAIWTGNQIFSVSKTGVRLVTNKTSYQQNGGWPIYNCWLAKKPLATGMVLTSCLDAVSGSRHYFVLDPTKDEIYDYAGEVPDALRCTENANKSWTCPANHEWVSFQATAPIGAPTGAVAATEISDGWFFNSNSSLRILFFADRNGNTIQVAEIGDVVRLLITYRH